MNMDVSVASSISRRLTQVRAPWQPAPYRNPRPRRASSRRTRPRRDR
jgi:hypothetical protein